jgi:S1-C subfamily serine protease
MCGLGVCGCVSFATQTLVETWREAMAAESALPGFGLQRPKPESELARAGVRGGDRLLAVDGQEVRSVRDIQAAIRKHALGEEVRLLVQRGSEPARDIGVRHVSDYPEE